MSETFYEKLGKGTVAGFVLGLMVLFLPVALMPFYFLQTWVLTKLWTWFMVPLGVPALSFWPALGAYYTVGYIFRHYSEDKRKWSEKISTNALGPFVTLFVGWVIHWMILRYG